MSPPEGAMTLPPQEFTNHIIAVVESPSRRHAGLHGYVQLHRAVVLRHQRDISGVSGMKYFETLEQEVSSWPRVSIHPHRFGGREFRFGSAEIGHVHTGGTVDIPFPRSVRNALLADGLVEEHRWVPNSGWITFQIRSNEDAKHAVWLIRLSYLRYALKTASDPRRMLDEQAENLGLSPQYKSLLEPFISKSVAA
jgi:hypothetical protein